MAGRVAMKAKVFDRVLTGIKVPQCFIASSSSRHASICWELVDADVWSNGKQKQREADAKRGGGKEVEERRRRYRCGVTLTSNQLPSSEIFLVDCCINNQLKPACGVINASTELCRLLHARPGG